MNMHDLINLAKQAGGSSDARRSIGQDEAVWKQIETTVNQDWQDDDETALATVRLLRNLMAGVSENQKRAIELSLDQSFLDSVSRLKEPSTILVLQTLANMILGNSELQNQIWQKWLDKNLFPYLMTSSNHQIGDTLLMLLINMIQNNPSITSSLINTQSGNELLKTIYTSSDSTDSRFQLVYLFTKSLVSKSSLSELVKCLAIDGNASHHQVEMLKILDAIVHQEADMISIDTIKQLFQVFHAFSERSTDLLLGLRNEVEYHDLAILSVLLQSLARLGEQMTTEQKHVIATETDALGWLIVLLKDLHAHRPRLKPSAASDVLHKPPEHFDNPFYLLKSDVIHVLGNLAYASPTVQDQVRARSGIPLILDNCNLDPENPFIRERALFTLRNLLTNNAENQALIKAMEPQQVVTDEFLDQVGVNVEIDSQGKLNFKSR